MSSHLYRVPSVMKPLLTVAILAVLGSRAIRTAEAATQADIVTLSSYFAGPDRWSGSRRGNVVLCPLRYRDEIDQLPVIRGSHPRSHPRTARLRRCPQDRDHAAALPTLVLTAACISRRGSSDRST
jgi:hypothetical protein